MKEIPILMSTEMVRAILDGRKTMTRRMIKPQPDDDGLWNDTDHPRSLESDLKGWNGSTETGESKQWKCPYGNVGDLLWVRETFEVYVCNDGGEDYTIIKFLSLDLHIQYATSLKPGKHPSIHMPKDIARIWLEVADISVERLQDISEQDAIAEGVQENICDNPNDCPSRFHSKREECCGKGEYFNYAGIDFDPCPNAVESFQSLWQSINGEESWKANPWVWVISFKVLSTSGRPAEGSSRKARKFERLIGFNGESGTSGNNY